MPLKVLYSLGCISDAQAGQCYPKSAADMNCFNALYLTNRLWLIGSPCGRWLALLKGWPSISPECTIQISSRRGVLGLFSYARKQGKNEKVHTNCKYLSILIRFQPSHRIFLTHPCGRVSPFRSNYFFQDRHPPWVQRWRLWKIDGFYLQCFYCGMGVSFSKFLMIVFKGKGKYQLCCVRKREMYLGLSYFLFLYFLCQIIFSSAENEWYVLTS